jgi:hypothetical protein
MKHEIVAALVVACLATLATRAHADPDVAKDPPTGDTREHVQARVAVVGEYRSLYDLAVLGGGVVLSLGKDGDKSGQINLRIAEGRTLGGLHVLDIGLGGSAEFILTGGLFIGTGGGMALFGVERATDGSEILSFGPELYGRVGYQFARRDAPFLTLDFGCALEGSNWTPVWGPTLGLGYRF